jgi:aldehyde dehydrogenase (NAD+)
MTTTEAVPNHRMLVGGAWQEAQDGGSYPTVNPATEEVAAYAAEAGRGDMRRAIESARTAFDDGPWPGMDRRARSAAIHRIADALERRYDAIVQATVTELGATKGGAAGSTAISIAMLRDYAELASAFPFEENMPPQTAGGRLAGGQVLRQPVGVCGLLPTWNAPLVIAIRKIGPALASGCTAVMKSPPQTPSTLVALAEAVTESDLPPGVFNLVTGAGIETSQELVASPLVDMVSFTGSVETGRLVMAAAAATVKRVTLELGGKSANVVLDGVAPDEIAAVVAMQACANAGQVCSMLSRILVPRAMADDLAKAVTAVLERQRVGDPADPAVTVGPLIREERRAAVEQYVRSGVEEGATLVTGGSRPAGISRGYFFEPTLFTDVRRDMTIAQEEIFGPVLALIPYDTVDEAVQIANDTMFGLQANVVSTSVADALGVAKRLRCGSVSINGATDPIRAPRGGFKQSGLGRECGKWGLDDYLEYQSIAWPI